MIQAVDYPLLVFALSFLALCLSTWLGSSVLRRRRPLTDDAREDFGVILAATMTLLGLIIGFTFSMAISRYDQRKVLEEEEANAIGTAYVRADLLPAADAARVRALLKAYLEQRMLFYTTRDAQALREVNATTVRLHAELWAAVVGPAAAQPTPITGLVVAAMNDVLNSQGYTQAAWWNRIPVAAWLLLLMIAISANVMVGYGARNARAERSLLLVLPLVVSISFFLIADIDSPRGGVIRVFPQNLYSLAESLRTP